MFNLFKKDYLKKAEREYMKIDALGKKYSSMSDEELKKQTQKFKEDISNGASLDGILPDAFALVRESCDRVLGKRPYPVQMVGGIVLHNGQIAEMKTGEGKANPVTFPIPTPDGWKTCGDIKVGDMLFDKYGKPTKVLGVYPQNGKKMVFNVNFADERVVPCANEHLWDVYDKCDNFKEKRTLTAKELLDQDKLHPGRFYIELSEAVEYDEISFPDSPSMVVYEFFENIRQVNELSSDRIQRLGEDGRKELIEKSLVNDYLISSIDQRWEMLDAFFKFFGNQEDQIGYKMTIPTDNETVIDFVSELIYSLGMAVKKHSSNGSTTFKILSDTDGVIGSKLIQITGIDRMAGQRVPMVCFEVDNEEHLFLVGDYIVTHNTIVSAAPIYLNALSGKVHVITVNDYLAERDKNEIGKVLNFLGVSVGLIYPQMPKKEKQEAYSCDVIYGTNKEFGFDYLRDNMAKDKTELLQSGLNFAIIDEVDSVLIDEARTPLIISGQGFSGPDLYKLADYCVRNLEKGIMPKELTKMESAVNLLSNENDFSEKERIAMKDYIVDEKDKMVVLTDQGVEKVEQMLGLSLAAEENVDISHHIHQALVAYGTMKKDENYIVKDGKVQIVDDFTGRVLDGRRYSDGLHQAIEAKEKVEIQEENKTLATISLQNYFRLYDKIAGMTGTAKTEEIEFRDIYKMNVVQIPTNLPVIRDDREDLIYITEEEKLKCVIEDIKKHHSTGQPVLVGTPTIEQSEIVSRMLKKEGIKHNLLNAKNNELEAHIIAQAGTKGAITIATNMAGRGTDIMLGGNPEFLAIEDLERNGLTEEEINIATNFIPAENEDEQLLKDRYQELLLKQKGICKKRAEEVRRLGGLHVIGTAKHESRRIDNQLRGRSGRQGDPGSSQFFLSLDDDVIRIFAGPSIKNAAKNLGLKHCEPIRNKQLVNMVETAQKRFETKNFDIRKNTLEYDDVNNIQRQIIYKERAGIVNGDINVSSKMEEYIKDTAKAIVQKTNLALKNEQDETKRTKALNNVLKEFVGIDEDVLTKTTSRKEEERAVADILLKKYNKQTNEMKKNNYDAEKIQNNGALQIIDQHWIDYITAIQNLRDLTSMTGYGNTKPVDVYKARSLEMFNDLLSRIKADIVYFILNYQVVERTREVIDLGLVEVSL